MRSRLSVGATARGAGVCEGIWAKRGQRQRGAEADCPVPSHRGDPARIRTPGRDNDLSYVSVGKYGLQLASLAMLNRIAAALGQRMKLRFVRVSSQLNR